MVASPIFQPPPLWPVLPMRCVAVALANITTRVLVVVTYLRGCGSMIKCCMPMHFTRIIKMRGRGTSSRLCTLSTPDMRSLYPIHSGYAVSLPHMIFQEMCKVHKLFTESKKDPEKKRPLPFPHLLTMLFLNRPGPTDVPLSIPSDEESIPCSNMYDEVRWTQSVTSILHNMQHAHPAMML